jgi:hypothetical protein
MLKLIKGFFVGVSMLGKCWTVGDLSTVWCWLWCSPDVIHLNLFHMQRILTYLLTYSMDQSPSWEANWFAPSQEIPHIFWNLKVHYHIHKCPPPVPILSQLDPVPHIPRPLFHVQNIIFINVHYMFTDYMWIEDVFKSLHLKRNMKWDVEYFLLGISPVSELSEPTFRNLVSVPSS